MTPGAIGQAMQTGQMVAPQMGRAAMMARMQQDPQFVTLAQQYGPELAMQMMQDRRASVSRGVESLQGLGQTQDPREQMMALMRQAQM